MGMQPPAIEKVRVDVTGLGNRGSGTVQRLASLEGVEIKALNDLEPERVSRAKESIDNSLHDPVGYSGGEEEWKRMCERDDIDLIAIAPLASACRSVCLCYGTWKTCIYGASRSDGD